MCVHVCGKKRSSLFFSIRKTQFLHIHFKMFLKRYIKRKKLNPVAEASEMQRWAQCKNVNWKVQDHGSKVSYSWKRALLAQEKQSELLSSFL